MAASSILLAFVISCVAMTMFTTALDINSGFLIGNSADDGSFSLKVVDKVHSLIHCHELKFSDDGAVGAVGSSPFKVMKNPINGKAHWYNGKYYLSYVKVSDDKSAPFGTWIIGDRPGRDSGAMYLKPKYPTFVPANCESDETSWHILHNKTWDSEPTIRLECTEDPIGDYFFTVKHIGSREISFMIPEEFIDVSAAASPPVPNPNTKPTDEACTSSCQMVYWHNIQNKWIRTSTTSFVSISPGIPVNIYTVARGWMSDPALLVGDEDNIDSWRLYFRHTDLGSEIETKIDIGDSGVSNGANIRQLSAAELISQRYLYEQKIFNARQGDYLWVWLRSTGEKFPADSLQRRYLPSNVLPSPGDIAPYLLRCEMGASETGSTAIFTFHDEHRRHIMERSLINMHTNLLSAHKSSEESSSAVTYLMNNIQVEMLGVVNIGEDVVEWIHDHLKSHDGILNPEISSCFFYHGGMTIPDALVYAAEIVCVLIGAKPLTLIQYTTPSDQQWKFPVVTELVQAIISYEAQYRLLETISSGQCHGHESTADGQCSALVAPRGPRIKHTIFKYIGDETLILYRDEEEERVELLKPYHIAQALHIVPYPPKEADTPKVVTNAAHSEQVFNSYFNGYVLGYPSSFVESYCKDLQNELSEGEVRSALIKSKAHIAEVINEGKLSKALTRIRINRTSPISEEYWNFIKKRVNPNLFTG